MEARQGRDSVGEARCHARQRDRPAHRPETLRGKRHLLEIEECRDDDDNGGLSSRLALPLDAASRTWLLFYRGSVEPWVSCSRQCTHQTPVWPGKTSVRYPSLNPGLLLSPGKLNNACRS